MGVIKKVNGSYDWFKYQHTNADGCIIFNYHEEKVYDLINDNRYNQVPPVYSCDKCKCVNALTGSYIAFVEEDVFLADIDKYVNNAYDKSENDGAGYTISIVK